MNIIIVLILLILIIFGLSSDQRLNEIIKDKSVPVIMLLIIFYFFFNKIDLRILCVVFIIILLFFSKFGKKFRDKINNFIGVDNKVKKLIHDTPIVNNIVHNIDKETLFKNISEMPVEKTLDVIEEKIIDETPKIELGTPICITQQKINDEQELKDMFSELKESK